MPEDEASCSQHSGNHKGGLNKMKADIDNYILQNYKIKTNAQMAQELGCNKSTISNHRKKLGISATELNSKLREQTDYICSQRGKKTKAQLAKELNCSISFIKKIWAENETPKIQNATYFYNQNYFEQIDTPQKAYWLGFIAADGNLYRREGHQGLVSISISEKDIELLNNFKNELQTTKPIQIVPDKRRPETIMATLQITGDKFFNDLLSKGVGIRKTFDMDMSTIFSNLPFKFYSDFILGYFDGDGSIDIPQDGTISRSHIRISGPIKTLEVFKKILTKVGISASIQVDKRKYTEPFGSLELTSTIEKYAFLKYIYRNKVKCLTRKYERSLELIERIENNSTNRSENIRAIENYKSVVVKWEELLKR